MIVVALLWQDIVTLRDPSASSIQTRTVLFRQCLRKIFLQMERK